MLKAIAAAAFSVVVPAAAAAAVAATAPTITLTRLDCGSGVFADFNGFFSDTLEYPPGPRTLTDSCYLIRHADENLLWDTGFSADLAGGSKDMGGLIASLARTIPGQLGDLGLKASDIAVVGVSHKHGDHTGQAKDFPSARLVIGKAAFEQSAGKDDPFGPWRGKDAKVTLAEGGDVDIFGDGSVIALNLPGHTQGHLALLVKLASGPVLLSGNLYHATMAREMRGVPPFNANRADTLASMDRFERLAKQLGAKVIIQHEPADIAKLPAFPKAAQ